MQKRLAVLTAMVGVVIGPGSPAAHHSLVQFDLTEPMRVKGAVVRFERVNPHSLIFLDQTTEDGRTERWAVDGPTLPALVRMGIDEDFLKAGDVIEVCGFPLKDAAASQRALEKLQARVMSGHLVVMPDGTRWFWSDYGQFDRCLEPGETRADIIRTR